MLTVSLSGRCPASPRVFPADEAVSLIRSPRLGALGALGATGTCTHQLQKTSGLLDQAESCQMVPSAVGAEVIKSN